MLEIGDISVNTFDLIVGVILLVSGLFAFARGFTREVLAIGCWIGAIIVTALTFDLASPAVQQVIQPEVLADGIVVVGIFIVTLALLTVISHRISGRVRESSIGAIDRTLGFFFGLVRGALIISALYLLLSYFLPREEHPDWVRSAASLPLVEKGAKLVFAIFPHLNVPEGLKSDSQGMSLDDMFDASNKAEQLYDALTGESDANSTSSPQNDSSATDAPTDSRRESGYKPDSRREMDRLIEGLE